MKKYKIIFCFILLAFFSAKGQINTYSPYSHFGIGQLYNANSISNISMGGLGLSIMDQHTLNYINPATYSFLTQTSFELGFRSSFLKMSQDDLDQKNFVSGLSNMGLGFPVSKNIGFAIGLLPHSSVGYNVTSQVLNDDDIGLVDYTYSGSGGVNKILIGAGWQVVDMNKINVSVGANFNYFFGSIDKIVNISTQNSAIQFREQKSNIINDFNFDLGILMQYSINNYIINLGTSITPKKSIQSTTDLFQHTHMNSGNYESFIDTILYVNGDKDHINMPLSYSMGLSIESDLKWLIGVDYHYTNWQDYNIIGGYMRDKNEIIVGGKFTPKQGDIHNYFNRVEYKLGFSYGIGYLDLGDATSLIAEESLLQDISISAGMALPLNRVSSQVNIGFRYGNRGYLENSFIKERYWTIYLSMTLNEKWFKKRKIE